MLTCALLACATLLAGGRPAPQTAASRVSCAEIDLPVSVSVPTPGQTMHGQLCLPAGRVPTTVQLLVPGGTYNRLYWDFPYRPERYSYQRDMAAHGYPTFAVDRLGVGRSSKPPSVLLVDSVEAASIHQVVDHLRAGRVGGVRFDRVVVVGHSLGSAVAALEAATYHDVDGVVLTSITHLPSVLALTKGLSTSQLLTEGSDPGYVRNQPGQRAEMFYVRSNADPQVIATDEATKDQVSLAGTATVTVSGFYGPASLGIDVAVLLAIGAQDSPFCGSLARDCSSAEALRKGEALYFSPAAELSTYVLPEAGHALALHNNSGAYREATRAWLRDHFGR